MPNIYEEDINNILKRISYPSITFRASYIECFGPGYTMVYLKAFLHTLDVDTDKETTFSLCGHSMNCPVSENALVRSAYSLVMRLVAHEANHHFTYKNVALFDEHINVVERTRFSE